MSIESWCSLFNEHGNSHDSQEPLAKIWTLCLNAGVMHDNDHASVLVGDIPGDASSLTKLWMKLNVRGLMSIIQRVEITVGSFVL
jgi:hypothetical protein